jgi:tight adherence protein B
VTPILVNLLTFLAMFLAIFAANAALMDLYSGERRRIKQRMKDQHRTHQQKRIRTAAAMSKDFSQIATEAKAENAKHGNLSQSFQLMIEQAGLELTVARLMTIACVSGALAGVLCGALFMSLAMSIVAAAAGFLAPVAYVHLRRNRRLKRLRGQLPDAFDLMGRVMRSGQTITQAMQAVAEEFDDPVSTEFMYCYEQMNLGMTAEDALRDLGRRTGLLEIKIFVLSVVVHRQTGGNMAELLDKLAHVVRERFRIDGMINSLTAQGRFQAGILLSMPPAMFLLLMVLHREYEMMLLDYPMMIVTALGLMAMGAMWIRKIVNFDY